jgi:hypothetical protein
LIALMILSIALLPVYKFPSGGFQLCDIPIFLIFLITVCKRNEANPFLANQLRLVFPYILWVILVNGVYSMFKGNYISYIVNSGTIVYGILTMYVFALNMPKMFFNLKYVYLALFLSIILTFTVKGHSEEGVRYLLSFNNPNQLGYFSVLLLANVAVLISWKKRNHLDKTWYSIGDLGLFLIAHYFAIISVSRAAIFAVVIIDLWLIKYLVKNNLPLLLLATMLVLSFALTMGVKSSFVQDKISGRGKSFNLGESFTENQQRLGSQLVFTNPLEFLVGAGKGRGDPAGQKNLLSSRNYPYLEVHNLFGDILRSYGLIGLALFSVWMFKLIWDSRILSGAFWIWAAVLMYNMSHNGIRFRSFWILLAMLITIINYANINSDFIKTKTN